MKPNVDDDCLPLSKKLIYCLPTVSTLPVIVLLAAFGNSLYELCGADLSLISACIAGARSMDVITDPGMSYITDAFRSKWGRRRPFLATGCWVYGISLLLLLTPPYASGGAVGAWFGVMYIGYFLTNTYTNIPYDALGPELTDNYEDRSRLFFISGLFDGGGTLAAVGMPTAMTTVAGKLSYNDAICKPDGSKDNVDGQCRLGLTCKEFIKDRSKPFVADSGQNSTEVAWLATQTVANLSQTCDEIANIQNYYASLPLAHTDYCICRRDCLSACSLANKRLGFMIVGFLFGGWYIVTIMLVFFRISERSQVEKDVMKKSERAIEEHDQQFKSHEPSEEGSQPNAHRRASLGVIDLDKEEGGETKNPPIVPMLLTTLFNKSFTVLLPAWACDGMVNAIIAALLTYYIRYVISPEYQTKEEHGIDCAKGVNGLRGTDNFSHWCATESVLAGCCCALFVAAAAATPMWLYLVKRIGKVNTWLLWSLVMALTNILFIFPGRGDIYACAVICGFNGVPLGAKFLADSILADIIDYDEFLTGTRREATYTMFKSFLPKIMAIPSIAIPISLMNAVGHVPPENGLIQEQPDGVGIFLKIVGAVLTSVVSWLAYFLKRRFPLKTKEQVDLVAEGVAKHLVGEKAPDPITGRLFMYTRFSNQELQYVWQLDHFMGSQMIEDLMITDGPERLLSRTQIHLAGSIATCIVSFVLTIVALGPLKLMSNSTWSFLPTLLIVCLGMSVVMIFFCVSRFKAARKIVADTPSQELLRRVKDQRIDLEALLKPMDNEDEASGSGGIVPDGSDGGKTYLPPIQIGKGKANMYNTQTDTE